MLAGRGFGKTRAGAEWVNERVWHQDARRIILVGQTPTDVRDIMLEGESGLLHIGPPDQRPQYNPSKMLLEWPNGALGHVRSGAQPDKVRGLQGDTAWLDELASWQYPRETKELLDFCLRLGDPKTVITTTPKPLRLLKDIMAEPGTTTTRGATYANIENLAAAFIEQIVHKYEGTTLGAQELYGDLLDEAQGALWNRAMLDATRVPDAPEPLPRIVVAIDPAVSADDESNETGIVAGAVDRKGHGYVLRDRSGRWTPDQWARQAVDLYHELKADRIVAERNQGGDMVRHTLQTVDRNVPVTLVHASRSKQARAEPVAAMYEQGRIHHVGHYADLEDQLCTWEPGSDSPDRLDALVWAMTDLLITRAPPLDVAPISMESENPWTI
jgi:phage terminase large subunit-like protein